LPTQALQVSGRVKNNTNQNIAYASVLVLKISDYYMVSEVSVDETEFFTIYNIEPDIYFL
jgi:hypothetical protein